MNKFQFLNALNSMNPVSIIRGKQKVKHNKIIISYSTVINILAKELPYLVKEMPNFLEYEICAFQEAARNGEFVFPKYHRIEESIVAYFKEMEKHSIPIKK